MSTSTVSNPRLCHRFTAASNKPGVSWSPEKSRSAGMPIRMPAGRAISMRRAYGSAGSKTAATSITAAASAAEFANTETQSSERQAGTTPRVLSSPFDGFHPNSS